MKYYYYLDNQRYVSDRFNLNQCKNVRFRLEQVDEDGVGLGIFDIVMGGELRGEDKLFSSSDCSGCPTPTPATPTPTPATPTPAPISNKGKCICNPNPKPSDPSCTATECSGGSISPTIDGCNSRKPWGCIWQPGNPCVPNPCNNDGICNKNTDGGYTCSCNNCFTGDTCDTPNIKSGCNGGEGCNIDLKTCIGTCYPNCYTLNSNNKCIIKDCANCQKGTCICDNDKLICSPRPKLPPHAIVGYWGSGGSNNQNFKQIYDALDKGYNIIVLAFGGPFNLDGTFKIKTNLGSGSEGVPTKSFIDTHTKKDPKDWLYMLSLGGQNGRFAFGEFKDKRVDIQQNPAILTFATGFISQFKAYAKTYGFQGIDIDIETGFDQPIAKAFSIIIEELYKANYHITMAPQPNNILPVNLNVINAPYQTGNWNAYVPIVDTSMIQYISYVAPQIYNNNHALPSGYDDPVKYIELLNGNDEGWGQVKGVPFGTGIVNIPYNKITLGYSCCGTKSARSQPLWTEPDNLSSLVQTYQKNPNLLKTGGIMTWSIDWDAKTQWKWIDTMKQIYP